MGKKHIMSLIFNILIFILEIVGFCVAEGTFDIKYMSYYTRDSNFILLISSLLFLIWSFKGKEIPMWIQSLKYMSAVSVTITFIVVLTILSWSVPGGLKHLLFHRAMFYQHLICPVLAIISFIFFEEYDFNSKKDVIRSLYFTFIYAIIMISLNILKIVQGPYPFLMVYRQSIFMSIFWFIIIIFGAFLVAVVLKKLNNKLSINKNAH